MTSRGPKVQDFTSTESKLAVHISTSPSYEFLLSLFVYGGKTGESPYAGTSSVTEAVSAHGSPELKSALNNLTECGCGMVWLSLIGNAFEEVRRRTRGNVSRKRIAMIGDTLHTDILGAAAAGWQTVLVTGHGVLKDMDVSGCIAKSGIVPDFIVPSI